MTSRPRVVKVGGALFDDAAALSEVVLAIAGAPSGGLVVVHGGGSVTDRLLTALGIETPRIDGLRSTPDAAIDAVVGSLAGVVNHRLVSALRAGGARAVGLTLTDGMMCDAERVTVKDGDLGRVGTVANTDGALLRALLASGFTPVVSSIGDDGEGGALNVNADDAAAGVARACDAAGLVLLTDVAGVLDENGARLERLDASETRRLIDAGVIAGGMIPKVNGALGAAQQLGVAVTIASWRDARALSALSSGGGLDAGTRFEPSGFNAAGPAGRCGAMR